MSALAAAVRAAGVAWAAAAAYALYWGWQNFFWLRNALIGGRPPEDATLAFAHRALTEQRLLAMLVLAMLALTLFDWLWRQTLGRVDAR